MTPHSPESSEPETFKDITEADAAEQAVRVDPDDELSEADTLSAATAPVEADPADVWEQHLSVPVSDDDDYEREVRHDRNR